MVDDISHNGKENYTLQHFKERINIYNGEDFNYETITWSYSMVQKTTINPLRLLS